MSRKIFGLSMVLVLAAILRLYAVDQYPAGLNADEAAIGYNAYSLSLTGQDEHKVPWPLVFRSFDDYKPALYFYIVLPFVKLLGLNIWAVRLPSALFGVLAVYLAYLIGNNINDSLEISRKKRLNLGFLTGLVLATSPWHIHFSRGGWEVNVATTFALAGVLFLLRKKTLRNFLIAALFFALSIWTYHANRVIIPAILLVYFLLNFKELITIKAIKAYLPALLLGALIVLPIGLQLLSKEGQARFSGVSIFADEGPLWEALEMRRQHQNSSSLPVRLLHSRYVTYSLRYAKNYLSHFSPRFLFVNGDEIARSKIPGMGQMYLITAPFVLVGFITLLRRKSINAKFILGWLMVAPIAAALTFQSPHALRAQSMSIPLAIVAAVGFITVIEVLNKRQYLVFVAAASILLCFETVRFGHYYLVHYPKELSFAWEYGFEQMVSIVGEYKDVEKVVISDKYDQPYIITAFFLKYPPIEFQNEVVYTNRDKFGFATSSGFGKYSFRRINFEQDKKLKNSLLVLTDEVADREPDRVVLDPGGKPAFRIFVNQE